MPPDTKLPVTLTAAEWQIVLNALYQRPYIEVKALLDGLTAQLAEAQKVVTAETEKQAA